MKAVVTSYMSSGKRALEEAEGGKLQVLHIFLKDGGLWFPIGIPHQVIC